MKTRTYFYILRYSSGNKQQEGMTEVWDGRSPELIWKELITKYAEELGVAEKLIKTQAFNLV